MLFIFLHFWFGNSLPLHSWFNISNELKSNIWCVYNEHQVKPVVRYISLAISGTGSCPGQKFKSKELGSTYHSIYQDSRHLISSCWFIRKFVCIFFKKPSTVCASGESWGLDAWYPELFPWFRFWNYKKNFTEKLAQKLKLVKRSWVQLFVCSYPKRILNGKFNKFRIIHWKHDTSELEPY